MLKDKILIILLSSFLVSCGGESVSIIEEDIEPELIDENGCLNFSQKITGGNGILISRHWDNTRFLLSIEYTPSDEFYGSRETYQYSNTQDFIREQSTIGLTIYSVFENSKIISTQIENTFSSNGELTSSLHTLTDMGYVTYIYDEILSTDIDGRQVQLVRSIHEDIDCFGGDCLDYTEIPIRVVQNIERSYDDEAKIVIQVVNDPTNSDVSKDYYDKYNTRIMTKVWSDTVEATGEPDFIRDGEYPDTGEYSDFIKICPQ